MSTDAFDIFADPFAPIEPNIFENPFNISQSISENAYGQLYLPGLEIHPQDPFFPFAPNDLFADPFV